MRGVVHLIYLFYLVYLMKYVVVEGFFSFHFLCFT